MKMGKKKDSQNPLIQVYNQKEQLLSWLRKNNFSIPPIESQIVISNPHTILKTSSEYVRAPFIIHSEELLNRIKYLEDTLTEKDRNIITDSLLSKHTEFRANVQNNMIFVQKSYIQV